MSDEVIVDPNYPTSAELIKHWGIVKKFMESIGYWNTAKVVSEVRCETQQIKVTVEDQVEGNVRHNSVTTLIFNPLSEEDANWAAAKQFLADLGHTDVTAIHRFVITPGNIQVTLRQWITQVESIKPDMYYRYCDYEFDRTGTRYEED